ncbi:MAG: hypothetical protein Fur0012_05960 [Elusimicrobiota bacterium]
MKQNNTVTLRVWGDFACFTRPEMKVERVSYPVMTPSAARGIFEAIYWEPQMYYIIDSIRVVKPVQWISFRRNELTKVISIDSAKTWMKTPEKVKPIQAGGGAEDATQRNMLALKNVEYLITAEVRTTPLIDKPEKNISTYLEQIKRRARVGKCFHRPALGVREFAADFELVEGDPDEILKRLIEEEKRMGNEANLLNEDYGLILYDVFAHNERADGFRWLREDEINAGVSVSKPSGRKQKVSSEKVRWKGKLVKPQAVFFHAKLEQSVLDCHPDRIEILTSSAEGGN